MIRRVFSISFLLILLSAGSGLSYIVSTHYLKWEAGKRSGAIKTGEVESSHIRLTEGEFEQLEKETLGNGVIEVQINGKHYDVYGIEHRGIGELELLAFSDTPEDQLQISAREKNDLQKNTVQQLPFFFFYFSERGNQIIDAGNYISLDYHFNLNFKPEKYLRIYSPPPDQKIA